MATPGGMEVDDEEKEQFGPPEESSALVMADASPLMQQPEQVAVAAIIQHRQLDDHHQLDAVEDDEITEIPGPVNIDVSPEKSLDSNGEMLSPDGRRRSTRASALRAQERLRGEYVEPLKQNQSEQPTSLPADSPNEKDDEEKSSAETEEEKPKKRKLLAAEADLDPRDPHFAIKMNSDGEVVVVEDSEFSSLHEEDIQHIRKNYMKVMMSQELTEEQRMERQRMIRQLQAELRLEEAKLMMLKKLRMSQQMPSREINGGIRGNAGAVGNTGSRPGAGTMLPMRGQVNTGAYRPPVATAPNLNRNQPLKTPLQSAAAKMNSNQQRPLAPAHQARAQIPPHLSTGHHRGQTATKTPTAHGSTGLRSDVQTPAQKQAAAKLALRKQLEKTLLQIPPPKPPPPEMHLVPNPNQPDFVYLVGLDLVVNRVHRDKKRQPGGPMQEPYLCMQCGTDFTPLWKAVTSGKDRDELKLMCEQCVRQNQKKALKAEHTNRLKQAFVKALQQEQEIEQQIQDGKFSGPVVAVAPVSRGSSPQVSSGSSKSVTPAAANSVAAATAAAMLRAPGNALAAAAAGLPSHFPFHNLFLNSWNPMIAGRFPAAAQAAIAAMAQAASTTFHGAGGLIPPGGLGNLPKELAKTLEQQRRAMNQQVLMDMMPKTSSSLPRK